MLLYIKFSTLNAKADKSMNWFQDADSDATIEEDASTTGSYTGVREEQQAQLDILESLDDPHRFVTIYTLIQKVVYCIGIYK